MYLEYLTATPGSSSHGYFDLPTATAEPRVSVGLQYETSPSRNHTNECSGRHEQVNQVILRTEPWHYPTAY
jgi:hypothetical protein